MATISTCTSQPFQTCTCTPQDKQSLMLPLRGLLSHSWAQGGLGKTRLVRPPFAGWTQLFLFTDYTKMASLSSFLHVVPIQALPFYSCSSAWLMIHDFFFNFLQCTYLCVKEKGVEWFSNRDPKYYGECLLAFSLFWNLKNRSFSSYTFFKSRNKSFYVLRNGLFPAISVNTDVTATRDCKPPMWAGEPPGLRKENTCDPGGIRLQSLHTVSPCGAQMWTSTGEQPRIAEGHMKGMISLSPDSCIFPYTEKHKVL